MEDYRFKVNLGGMIEILSEHLYSSPDVFIRELLQNAADAITRRKEIQKKEFEGSITLEIEEKEKLIFADNGQGLMEEEIHRFLAIIGESSKRELTDRSVRRDYIGQFGIGLLSCFMVTDEICLITKSCQSKDAPSLVWRGRPDGTYTIETLQQQDKEALPSPGTKIILAAKEGMEEYFTREILENLITYYGLLLPFPVIIRQNGKEKQINPVYLPWEGRNTNKQELLLFGQMLFGELFLDCLTFRSEEGNVSGVAYILNYTVLPSAKPAHRIYLKHMMLTEKGDGLLPDWAVFTKCIVHATDLKPTASREGFYEDETLDAVRETIENRLIAYIDTMADDQPELFGKFFRVHQLTLMELALANPKLFRTLIDYFEFETTRGTLTGYDLRMCGEDLLYAPTREKYKQLSQLFFAQDQLLINVTYVHALELLEGLGYMFGISVSEVEEEEIEDLMEELAAEEQEKGLEFLNKANKILKDRDCRAELKCFQPANQPAFFLMDEEAVLNRQIAISKNKANSIFREMLNMISSELKGEDAVSMLYLNYNNPIVKNLIRITEEDVLKIFVEIIYIQALQIGGFPLRKNDMATLNQNILLLMERDLADKEE
ncbi:HSP90 family protein [Petralouisia muris]|jgi:molecular chaperone HtpG|uniref:HSP90 family protein n=1 Tax=Petralouisia muris TaxID=3032872 RepID=UPI0014424AD2|nr:HSP90 family protein [Petralouisia muris]